MEKELKPGQNTGVIIDVRPTDFIAGGETGVGAQPTLEAAGAYDLYLPDEETQYNLRFDLFACVSFSALNCLEIIFNLKIARGQFSAAQIAWLKEKGYIDYRTGKVNFSDRAIAKLSGTTRQGNSLGAVGDAINTYGLVPEALWPWPKEITEGMDLDTKWGLYYAPVPQAVIDLGKEFKARFKTSYQWINASGQNNPSLITGFLPKGPIQIAAAVCAPWNSTEAMPPIKGCGCGTQHATLIYGHSENGYRDFDSYRSFKKVLALDYCIPYAMQYYANEITATTTTTFSVNLYYGAPAGAEVSKMQLALQTVKDKLGVPYLKPGVFGPFGPQTKAALARFQKDSGILDDGTNFGPRTRAALAAALARQ